MQSEREMDNAKAGRRILIVDDNVDAADSLALILRAGGHEAVTAYSPASALEIAAKNPDFDVFILDIGLPGMNGYELAQELRKSPHTKQAFLIALTGYGQDTDRERAYNAKFDAHCTKPIEYDVLNRLLGNPKARDKSGASR